MDTNATLNASPFAPLHRNVSSNLIMLIPADIRGDYGTDSGGGAGVLTEGVLGAGQAVAISGMASCGGLILKAADGNFIAIHIGGDARGIVYFETEIKAWRAHHGGVLTIVGATGPSGNEDGIAARFIELITEYVAEHPPEVLAGTVYLGQAAISLSYEGNVGAPTAAMLNPTRRVSGKSCCVIM